MGDGVQQPHQTSRSKNWGIARFYGMGSMEYMLESGGWLRDGALYDGAPIRLFDTMGDADAVAAELPQASQPHGVQFMLDAEGRIVTARKKAGQKMGRRPR